MDDIFVGQLMSTELQTVTPNTLVEEAANLMLNNGIGSLMVVDDAGKLRGILTTTDFVDIVAKSRPKADTTVERYMSTDVITTGAQVPIREIADLMVEHAFHHVPVLDGDDVIGIVTSTDLAAYLSTVQTPSPS